MAENYDFCGWATKNDLRCSDGRTIRRDAFKHNDGMTVPLVWNHLHCDPDNVLGHALLKNAENGVLAYGYFNNTVKGKMAKELVQHRDITHLSICANQLQQQGGDVLHGDIKEVSLVVAGANPGASIVSVMAHGAEPTGEALIYTDEELELFHADEKEEKPVEDKKTENKEKTIGEVFDTLTEEQKNVVYAMISMALEDSGNGADDKKEDENEGGNTSMKHNVFDQETENTDVLTHAEMQTIIADAKRYGSLKDSVLQHGITDIDYLFPEAKSLNTPPEFISRDMGWVSKVMNAVHHTPFSRIKSMFADITAEDARAKGYIKGNLKQEEVFSLLKRTTTPTTIYKKQKLDRDDVVDITDFDVVAWLKGEMRMMLNEELARAFLVGDGRSASSDDKINEQNIRPVWTDSDLYTIKAAVDVTTNMTADQKAKAFIRKIIKSRKDYKGSGNPVLFTTEDVLTDCLLLEDTTGRVIYDSVDKLATVLRVKEIVTVPVMANLTRKVDGTTHTLMGIIVNLNDYNVGADKGGAVNLFDDFDIDYNAQKYLIETRCSGALIKPYSAIVVEAVPSA